MLYYISAFKNVPSKVCLLSHDKWLRVTLVTCKCPKRDIFLWKKHTFLIDSTAWWWGFGLMQLSHHLTVNNWKSATLSISQREFVRAPAVCLLPMTWGTQSQKNSFKWRSLRVTRCNILLNSCSAFDFWSLRKANIACQALERRDDKTRGLTHNGTFGSSWPNIQPLYNHHKIMLIIISPAGISRR